MGSPVVTLSDALSCQHVYTFTPLLSVCLHLFEMLDPVELMVTLMGDVECRPNGDFPVHYKWSDDVYEFLRLSKS